MSNKMARNLIQKVEHVLWNDWDPIGMNSHDGTWEDEEYNSYAPKISKLLLDGADIYKIAARLYQISKVGMGLEPEMEHCRAVAVLLINLLEEEA